MVPADGSRSLLRGGLVFDGVSSEIARQDILIEGDTIVEVAPEITAEAAVLDISDSWVTPGFIDMHVHLWNLGWEVLPALVGNGVTTVRDLGTHWTIDSLGVGGDARRVRQLKLDVDSGKVVGPNIIYSGPMLHQVHPYMLGNAAMQEQLRDSSGDPGSRPIASPDDARAIVRHLIDEQGVGSIKIYESVQEPIAAAILEAADGRVPVTGHLGLTSSKFAMRHGIGGMEHLHQSPIRDLAPPHRRIDPNDWLAVPGYALTVLRAWAEVDLGGSEVEDWLRTLVDTGSFLDPTVTITAARPAAEDSRRRLFPNSFPRAGQRGGGGGGRFGGDELTEKARANQRGLMRLIYENGGSMVVGTDLLPGALPGWGYHAEMQALQRRGMKPIDVLRAATSVSAHHLQRPDLGRIAAGKRADMVLLARNPAEDVGNVDSITRVVKGGALYDASKLLAVAPIPALETSVNES
jgi:hypothetical protein